MKKIIKNTSQFLLERKNYESIREYIGILYLEPCINLDSRKLKAPAGHRDMLRRISSYINPEYRQKVNIENISVMTFLSDMYKCPVNYIADTFRYASYTHDELIYYITFLQILSTAGQYDDSEEGLTDVSKPFTKRDLCGDVRSRTNDADTYTIERIFNDLVDLGIIEKNQNKEYELSNDVLNNIDNYGALDKLLEMVIFFYNIHPLVIPGYMLAGTINHYLIYSFPQESQEMDYVPNSDVFIYTNKSLQNTIDNDITWNILNAVKNHQFISFEYVRQNGEKVFRKLVPVKVVQEQEYNRQYCYGYDPVTKTKSISRINKIKKLKILPEIYNGENLDSIFEEDFKYNCMTSDSAKYTKVQVKFSLPDNENIRQQIKTRLEKTKRKGTIKHINENTIMYETYTTDENELVPWINGFGRYAHVDKRLNTKLYNKLKEHNDELMVKYGLV